MKTANVTSAEKKKDHSVLLTITDPRDFSSFTKRYADIRGGLTWPTSKGSAYFCVLGQEYIAPHILDEKAPAGPYVLLAEYEAKSLSLTKFHSMITDIAEQFRCRDFYVDMPEARLACGYQSDFDKFASERHTRAWMERAYDADNFRLGISRIRGSIDSGNLIIPSDSILFEQLISAARSDLDDSPEEIFFAINALRHVIGSYYRNPPVIRNLLKSRLMERIYRNRPRGFMAA